MPHRPHPPTDRSSGPTAPRPRRAVTVGVALAATLAAGCVGQHSRNDDHVGPLSPRPDAREHTLGADDARV